VVAYQDCPICLEDMNNNVGKNAMVFKCDQCAAWFHEECCFINGARHQRINGCPICRDDWTSKNVLQDFAVSRPGPVLLGAVAGGGKKLRSTRHRRNRKSNSKKSKKRRRKTR
jgi:hypothetical protein